MLIARTTVEELHDTGGQDRAEQSDDGILPHLPVTQNRDGKILCDIAERMPCA
jgi:hypothetical protein